MSTIIIDLDGTLCDCSHRVHFAQASQWDEFHSRCSDDKVFEDVRALLKMAQVFHSVVAITGRNERYSSQTYEWLQRNELSHLIDHIRFRGDNDFTRDGEMKVKAVERFFGNKETALAQVTFAIDDRDTVVEAYRNYGLPCWQVRPGGY